jgi:hypothetical protein
MGETDAPSRGELTEYVPGAIWIAEYPVHYAGCDLTARMTVVKLSDGTLLLHSPCEIDDAIQAQLETLGRVSCIVAPGTYHYFYVTSAQEAYPDAHTWVCPGIERKCPDIDFDWLLGNEPDRQWAKDLDQVLVRGTRYIWETVFFHRASKTLIVTDLIEYIGDETPGAQGMLKFWWKAVFHMWNKPRPAPEYQMGWKNKKLVKQCLEQVLQWDFERIILAHGDNIESNARAMAQEAWNTPLSA